MKNLKKIIFLLTLQERKQAIMILGMVIIMALLEMVGIASIMPFMAILADPNIIETNSLLKKAFNTSNIFGVENSDQFLFLLGIFVFLLLIISLSFKALTTYFQIQFTATCQYSIGRRIVEGYLSQSYSWFLNKHSADLGKTILSEVATVVANGLSPMISLIVKIIISITILTLLILVDPKLALITGFILCSAYGLIYKFSRNFLSKIGQDRLTANQWRFTAVAEAFGAVKEIKVGGLEQTYIDRFSDPAKAFAKHQASLGVLNILPRFAVEAVAFGGIILIVLYLMYQSGDFAKIIPVLALYAFAGYRLMPALQGIYTAVSQLRYVEPALIALYNDLMSLQTPILNEKKDILQISNAINLKNINYQYPNAEQLTLKNINLSIPAQSTVGIVGATGSGKTTIVDIMLGLLEIKEGKLEVDGILIDKKNLRAWQRSIGYVPQQIYLSDDTIAANIAFGKNKEFINQEAVESAAKIANLHDFVFNELPMGYQTTVGERGVRLSGGQRQRIGIARALYNKPNVLILDEATSALDSLTERAVMEAIENLGNDITIILITHRLSTVKRCDNIFLIDKGELKQQGTFKDLKNINDIFRETAKGS